MNYNLPLSLEICGVEYEIRSDYRNVLDIYEALNDSELSEKERSFAALYILYPDFENMPPEHYEEAAKKLLWFINCGQEDDNESKQPKLMDWEQDFPLIVAAINQMVGYDIRDPKVYMHFWTFISYYQDIKDCLFAQVVSIRYKLIKGKKLDKQEQEFLRHNRKLVEFKRKYTAADEDLLKQWI